MHKHRTKQTREKKTNQVDTRAIVWHFCCAKRTNNCIYAIESIRWIRKQFIVVVVVNAWKMCLNYSFKFICWFDACPTKIWWFHCEKRTNILLYECWSTREKKKTDIDKRRMAFIQKSFIIRDECIYAYFFIFCLLVHKFSTINE